MHDAILAQPEALVKAIERNRDEVEELASLIASRGRIFLAGIGTSHHASLVGEHLMRAYGGGPDVRAVHSFDLALLAGRLGYHRTGSDTLPDGLLLEELPEALRAALGKEEEVAALAREHVGRRRIWLVGGGPSAVTATETALKIKETSYLQAEGMPTETMLHGPFQCVEADDLFVLVAPSGGARERTLEVAELAEEVGVPFLIFGDDRIEGRLAALTVPGVPEPLSALTCLVPLQLFAYHLALTRGTNPDNFRVDDPRFARADVSGRF